MSTFAPRPTTRATAPKPAAPKPSALNDDYVALCDGVKRLTGIDLHQYKRGQMERRIRTFATKQGHTDLKTYLKVLQADKAKVDEFLDRVTINVSQLWRNPEQWTLLGDKVLPELAKEGNRVRAWSAGCSYGAEAYTLAAVASASIPRARATIKGTDIDKRMVERARRGVFTTEDARSAPKAELAKWFTPDTGGFHAKPELKRLVSFDTGDLLISRIPQEAYDLVLCRNTVIYFNEEVRDALHERLVQSLRPGGVLMIGSTERVSKPRELGLEPTHPFVYRKS
ncbi:MAG TPA: protein-glutamate O-methyltransferase CheR [Solirubrobacteraceae bacterium]|nr:protein-glutamate O-methyltransferase CheR [Solirubrobacteraceae bacterium]